MGLPEKVPRSSLLTEAELQFYVSQYRERGFRSRPHTHTHTHTQTVRFCWIRLWQETLSDGVVFGCAGGR